MASSPSALCKDGDDIVIGVLALQGAFEEHEECFHMLGVATVQIRTPKDLTCQRLDGIVLPGGESTAMGLLGKANGIWSALQEFTARKPTWGTCAGLILLAERCIGASAVISEGQALIGGLPEVLLCRNYFGSQVDSFEIPIPPPPAASSETDPDTDYPGVFIRAPAILSVKSTPHVQILGTVLAKPCRQAAPVLQELEKKLQQGQEVVMMDVDGVEKKKSRNVSVGDGKDKEEEDEEKKEADGASGTTLPAIVQNSNGARNVICAIRRKHILGTAFHPELTQDYRWHAYFVQMVREHAAECQTLHNLAGE